MIAALDVLAEPASETMTLASAIRSARDRVRPHALAAIRSARTADELAAVARMLEGGLVEGVFARGFVDDVLARAMDARLVAVLDAGAGARWRARHP